MNIPEIIKQFAGVITESTIFLAGIMLFGRWLLTTSLGRDALVNSVPRRNNMRSFIPFIPLFIWFGAISISMSIAGWILTDLPNWQKAFVNNLILCLSSILTMAVIIYLADTHFARRLKGFGLDLKTIPRDFFAAIVTLLTIWPLLVLMIMLTIFFGKLILGQDFEMQYHQELELITAYRQLPLRILIVIATTVIAPVLEELLFRGMFQTMIRSFLLGLQSRHSSCPPRQSAWLSIVITAFLFATIHQQAGHWPTIFILGMSLGYAYEKSGSLFRPIFIHSLFNATSIITVLLKP